MWFISPIIFRWVSWSIGKLNKQNFIARQSLRNLSFYRRCNSCDISEVVLHLKAQVAHSCVGPSRQRFDENIQSTLGKVPGLPPSRSWALGAGVGLGFWERESQTWRRDAGVIILNFWTSLIERSQILGFLSSTHYLCNLNQIRFNVTHVTLSSVKTGLAAPTPIYLTTWSQCQIGRASHMYCASTMFQTLFQALQT